MLYRIIDPDWFAQCLEQVKRAYWPEQEYLNRRQQLAFASGVPARGEERIRETGRALEALVDEVAAEPLYRVPGNGGSADPAFALPFLNRFHRLFLLRQWNEPYRDPPAQTEELFRLEPPGTNGSGNYSLNHGN